MRFGPRKRRPASFSSLPCDSFEHCNFRRKRPTTSNHGELLPPGPPLHSPGAWATTALQLRYNPSALSCPESYLGRCTRFSPPGIAWGRLLGIRVWKEIVAAMAVPKSKPSTLDLRPDGVVPSESHCPAPNGCCLPGWGLALSRPALWLSSTFVLACRVRDWR